MNRIVEAEWLDSLPAEDARAVHSRGDLRRLNFLMQHARLMARQWRRMSIPTRIESVAELGAGDGTFCLRLLQRLGSGCKIGELILLDRRPAVTDQTRRALATLAGRVSVVQADVFDWLSSAPASTVVVANLFLHHFEEGDLRRLLTMASESTQFFLACEPRRNAWSLFNSRLLGLIGCNDVTRHDALASVRAGFAGRELSKLWPELADWDLSEQGAGLFSHLFSARRQHLAGQ